MYRLSQLSLVNRFSGLPSAFYTRQNPTPLPAPYLVAFNPAAAALIELDPLERTSADFTKIFAGNNPLPGADPLAAIYAGHQFGGYSPQLGDGRAILLGEVKTSSDEYWELQLKGAGETPYSRMGDGRAVLRSSIREYLCSEAMHGLGIPTTRALSITGSDQPVFRETVETAAVLLRMAPTFIRFGSFELFYYRQQFDLLKTLADFVIDTQYPCLRNQTNPYQALLEKAVETTAQLIAKWQAIGFCHGVMNSDNMSIIGLTLDYGPFGFLDTFDPGHICNHSDHSGRYAYNQQPHVGLWNLHCLAQALLPLTTEEDAVNTLKTYQNIFESEYDRLMRAKLGLTTCQDDDTTLISNLLGTLADSRVDYTIFFRRLADFIPGNANTALRDIFINPAAFDHWAELYAARLAVEASDNDARRYKMHTINPRYILRNHLVETAIKLAVEQRDFSEIERLHHCLQQPFAQQPEFVAYSAFPPEWASEISVSCSS